MEESDHRVVAEGPDVPLSISQDSEARQEVIGEVPVVSESLLKASWLIALKGLLAVSKTSRLLLHHPVTGKEFINVDDVDDLELDEDHKEEEKDAEGNLMRDAEGNPTWITNKHARLAIKVGTGVVFAWFTLYEIDKAVKGAKPQRK